MRNVQSNRTPLCRANRRDRLSLSPSHVTAVKGGKVTKRIHGFCGGRTEQKQSVIAVERWKGEMHWETILQLPDKIGRFWHERILYFEVA